MTNKQIFLLILVKMLAKRLQQLQISHWFNNSFLDTVHDKINLRKHGQNSSHVRQITVNGFPKCYDTTDHFIYSLDNMLEKV